METITILSGILSHEGVDAEATVAEVVVTADGVVVEEAPSGGFLGGILPMLLIYGAIFGAMWLLMIRPQRKRQKEQREMLDALRVGDNIVTSNGLFGKITDIGEDVYVVEFGTNKGVRIPVLKTDVAGVREPKLTMTTHN